MKERKVATTMEQQQQAETPSKMAKAKARLSAVPDSIVNLRAELTTALDGLVPVIRGLHYFIQVSSPDLGAEENAQVLDRERRRDLMQTVIAALDALVADGYPDLPQDMISVQLFAELQQVLSDSQAAAGVFQKSTAEHLQVNFDQPTSKE